MSFRLFLIVLFFLPFSANSTRVEVHEHYLDNGLKILVREDHRSPVVVSQLWYKVGSSYEPGGITGISHMLEHMMFKGTEKYPAGEFSRIIAENGGRENAFTGRDYTAYFQTMEKSRLEISFKLEADRMRNLRLNPDELKKELAVVTEERRMRTDDKPRSKMQEYFTSIAYSNSPYKNPIIGWPSDIANYQVNDLQKWYERWYAPNNATLVVVGDVNFEDVFALAEQYFSAIKPSQIEAIKPQAEIEQHGVRKTTVRLPAKLPYILLGYKVPVLNTVENEADAYALEVLAGILDGGNSARLASKLVRGQQIAVSSGASYNLISRLPSLFLLDATPVTGKTVFDMEYALKQEIYDLKAALVSDEELQRVKAQVLASAVYEQDSNFYQGMQLGMFEMVGLGWQKADEYVNKINQITAQQVRDVAQKYLLEDKLTIAYLDPQPITEQKRKSKTTGGRHAQ
ncbi:MAG: insulinase family protein [Methylococcales symbiont of Hymedesmia sp. n. MRB-2018]|nr:MAG: insulinase family protein [Methylococcales symbiont of Hymedesmia sp. n. MRB-2018]KAF3983454.1 MAG: insulinase family protein [Methylococcales symbiont of Hymedesmia sp. n. MRB-2018]